MIFILLQLFNLAAEIKVELFTVKTCALANLANLGQEISVSAITAFNTLPPNIPAIAIASTMPGKAKNTSDIRIKIVSILPPK